MDLTDHAISRYRIPQLIEEFFYRAGPHFDVVVNDSDIFLVGLNKCFRIDLLLVLYQIVENVGVPYPLVGV